MLKDVGLMTIVDAIAAIVIAAILFPKTQLVYGCSPELFWVCAGFCIYQCFFVVRNLLTILCSYWSAKPDDRALAIRICYSFIDWGALFALTLWSTLVLRK